MKHAERESSPMTLHRQAVRWLERTERLQRVSALVCGFGIAVLAVGICTLGISSVTNPKAVSSVYAVLQGEGYMRWLSVPMMAVGLVTVVAGLLTLALARRKSR